MTAPAAFRKFAGRGHRTAIPTERDGIRFPSKTEAAVYAKLKLLAAADGATLYRQCRFPLLNLAPWPPDSRAPLTPLAFTVDFVLRYGDGTMRAIDAKAKNWQSDEWQRGASAFEALYGIPVERCDK